MKKKKDNISGSKGKQVGKNYRRTEPLLKNRSGKKGIGKSIVAPSVLKEVNPSYSVSSRIRSIGNSKGVILPNRVIREAGLTPDADLIIQVADGVILIAEFKSAEHVNTDLSSWDKLFKNAIKAGKKPEADLWKGVQNLFDEEEWT